MIAASEPKEFSPFGRQQLERHPGEVFPPSTQPPVLHPESHLLHRLSQVAISDEPQQSERWVLRAGPDDPQCEEELYVSGKTAVWSRRAFSAHPGSAVLQCCYSCETRIRHALWCSFRTSGADEPVGDPIPCICLVDADSIRVFTAEGEDYIVYLQFEVSHVWACKYGLILERTTHANTSSKDYFNDTEQPQLSTIFSLLHPLDEITPVIGKHGGLSYMNDPSVNIVFVSENPSVCMVYDSKLGAHSIWKIRKAQPEECRYVCGFAGPDEATEQSASSASAGFPGHSTSSRGRRLSLLSGRGAVLAGYSPQSSARSHSPAEGFSHLQSPSPLASPPDWLSGVLRLPQLGASWLSPANSPGSGSPGLSAESRLMTSEMSDPAASRPICPELCFQHVWQEGAGVSRESGGGAASKAFFSSDFVGQTYLCYLVVSRSRLYYTRLEKANIEQQLIFGLESSVPAADAVNVPQLQLVAVLDTAGGVSLYSGLSVVGKLHVAGIHSALTTSSYLSLFGTHFASPCLPKRSSLILTSSLVGTHSRSTPATEPSFDEGVHLLSPVEPQGSEGNVKITPSTPLRGQLVALRDSVANRLSLEYSDGSMFRIALPDLCTSPLVARSVEALQLVLQRDLAMQLAVRWYGVRNAPGTRDLSPAHEWELFADTLLELLGYDVEKLAGAGARDPDRPSVLAKRRRSSEGGTPGDWHLLQGSAHHRALSWGLGALLGLQCAGAAPDTVAGDAGGSETGRVSSAAPLFCSAPLVLFTLHLLYQDLKLNVLLYEGLPLLARLLHQLAGDLRLPEYVQHYWRDFPRHCALAPARESQFQDADLKKLANLNAVPMEPPDIFQHLHDMLLGQECVPYPYISRLNKTSKNIVQLVALRTYGYEDPHLAVEGFVKLNVPLGKVGDPEEVTSARDSYPSAKYPMPHRAVLLMTELGVTRQDLQVLPAGVAFLVQDLVYQSRADPPLDWPRAAYCLVGREDLAAQCLGPAESSPEARDARRQDVAKMAEVDQEDGMDGMEFEVLRLLFSKDHRVAEVRRLLQSSQPVSIGITQRPDVSDHEFIEEQEKQLYALCTRTMAIPVGRGMFTLRSVSPVVTEPLPIPRLCLTGRAPPRGTTVDLTHIEVVPNMNLWPSFHNGVAAGLRIATHASNIASDWIIFNKPKGTAEVPVEHAGFLMALGLNGHLGNLMVFNKYEYLARCHEITSVGLLLGVAATKRGTMDLATTKMLSVHLEAFLPPTSIELDVPQNIQVAALLSIGLVYEGTAHRHTAEVLLAEIGRPPGPEMENSVDRESYSLAAGLGSGGLCQVLCAGRPPGPEMENSVDRESYSLAAGLGSGGLCQVLCAGRPPGPEMENSVDRESYSLAAGLGSGDCVRCCCVQAARPARRWRTAWTASRTRWQQDWGRGTVSGAAVCRPPARPGDGEQRGPRVVLAGSRTGVWGTVSGAVCRPPARPGDGEQRGPRVVLAGSRTGVWGTVSGAAVCRPPARPGDGEQRGPRVVLAGSRTGVGGLCQVLLCAGRPPGPEMENSVDRESYSLAAGLGSGGLCQVLCAGRPPGPEMENSVDRESYSLAAGLGSGDCVRCCCVQAARPARRWRTAWTASRTRWQQDWGLGDCVRCCVQAARPARRWRTAWTASRTRWQQDWGLGDCVRCCVQAARPARRWRTAWTASRTRWQQDWGLGDCVRCCVQAARPARRWRTAWTASRTRWQQDWGLGDCVRCCVQAARPARRWRTAWTASRTRWQQDWGLGDCVRCCVQAARPARRWRTAWTASRTRWQQDWGLGDCVRCCCVQAARPARRWRTAWTASRTRWQQDWGRGTVSGAAVCRPPARPGDGEQRGPRVVLAGSRTGPGTGDAGEGVQAVWSGGPGRAGHSALLHGRRAPPPAHRGTEGEI
ncbi:anaphase-promoting complex subunit 1 isoform X2 [Bacillus rossius redtenbacheri]|uniref:anaphase-promoting complex subunit 1 isoform X2 n=1 Tax=Bacillus rossius redtenbacheri TaxID=93214 RepID=UPI002FDE2139